MPAGFQPTYGPQEERAFLGIYTDLERAAADTAPDPAAWRRAYATSWYVGNRLGVAPNLVAQDPEAYLPLVFGEGTGIEDAYWRAVVSRGHEDYLEEVPDAARTEKTGGMATRIAAGVMEMLRSPQLATMDPQALVPPAMLTPTTTGLPYTEQEKSVARTVVGGTLDMSAGIAALVGKTEVAVGIQRDVARMRQELAPAPEKQAKLEALAGDWRQVLAPEWWEVRAPELTVQGLEWAVGGRAAYGASKAVLARAAPGMSEWLAQQLATLAGAAGPATAEALQNAGDAVGQLDAQRSAAEAVIRQLEAAAPEDMTGAAARALGPALAEYRALVARGADSAVAGRVAREVFARNVLLDTALNLVTVGGGKGAAWGWRRAAGGGMKAGAAAAVAGAAVEVGAQTEQELRQDEITTEAVDRVLLGKAMDAGLWTPRVVEGLFGDDVQKRETTINTVMQMVLSGSPAIQLSHDLHEARNLAEFEGRVRAVVKGVRQAATEARAATQKPAKTAATDKGGDDGEDGGLGPERVAPEEMQARAAALEDLAGKLEAAKRPDAQFEVLRTAAAEEADAAVERAETATLEQQAADQEQQAAGVDAVADEEQRAAAVADESAAPAAPAAEPTAVSPAPAVAEPAPKKHREPTILEQARDEIRKLFVTPADRRELRNAGVFAPPDRLTSDRTYPDAAAAAVQLAERYPALGIAKDDDLSTLVQKLYTGRARDWGTVPDEAERDLDGSLLMEGLQQELGLTPAAAATPQGLARGLERLRDWMLDSAPAGDDGRTGYLRGLGEAVDALAGARDLGAALDAVRRMDDSMSEARNGGGAASGRDTHVDEEQYASGRHRAWGDVADLVAGAAGGSLDGSALAGLAGEAARSGAGLHALRARLRASAGIGDSRSGRDLLAGLDRRAGSGGGSGRARLQARTVASAIAREFRAVGSVGLIGREAASADDLAVLAQVLRNPRYEVAHLVLVHEGKIVHAESVSCRLPGATTFYTGGASTYGDVAFGNHVAELARQSGATGWYLVHNHPSGDPTPSADDLAATQTHTGFGGTARFLGHVIVDTGKYAVLQPGRPATTAGGVAGLTPEWQVRALSAAGVDALLEPSLPHEVLGLPVANDADLAAVAKGLLGAPGRPLLFGLSRGRIRSVGELVAEGWAGAPERAAAMLRRFARQTGSQHLVLVVDALPAGDARRLLVRAVETGLLRDVVDAAGRSLVAQTGARPRTGYVMGTEPEGRLLRERQEPETVPITGEEIRPAGEVLHWPDVYDWADLAPGFYGVHTVEAVGWQVLLTRDGVSETLKRKVPQFKLRSIPALPELIRTALPDGDAADRKSHANVDRFEYLRARLAIGDEVYSVRITLTRDPEGGRRFYYHHMDLESRTRGIRPASTADGRLGVTPGSKDTDTTADGEVNGGSLLREADGPAAVTAGTEDGKPQRPPIRVAGGLPKSLLEIVQEAKRRAKARALDVSVEYTVRTAIRLRVKEEGVKDVDWLIGAARRVRYLEDRLSRTPEGGRDAVIKRELADLMGAERAKTMEVSAKYRMRELLDALAREVDDRLYGAYARRVKAVWERYRQKGVSPNKLLGRMHPDSRVVMEEWLRTMPMGGVRRLKGGGTEAVPDLRRLDVEDMRNRYETAVQAIRSSRARQEMLVRGRRATAEEVSARLIDEVQRAAEALGKPATGGGVTPKDRGYVKGFLVDLYETGSVRVRKWFGAETSVGFEMFYERLRAGETRAKAVEMEAKGKLSALLEANGYKESDRYGLETAQTAVELPGGRRVMMTAAERMYFAALWERAEGRIKGVRNGWVLERGRGTGDELGAETEEDNEGIADAILATIDERERKVVDGIVDIMTGFGPAANRVSLALHGYERFREARYFGMRADTPGLKADDVEGAGGARAFAESFGFVKETQDHGHALRVGSVFQQFDRHVRDMGRYIGTTLAIRDALEVLNASEGALAKALRERHGRNPLSDFEEMMLDLAGVGEQMGPGRAFLNRLTGNSAAYILGWNPGPYISNRVGGSLMYASELGHRHQEAVGAFLAATARPTWLREHQADLGYLKENGYLAERWSSDMTRVWTPTAEERVASADAQSRARLALRLVQQKALEPMKNAEQRNAVRLFQALTTAGGMTREAARDEVEMMTRETQNSSSPLDDSPFIRGVRKSGMGGLFPFMSQAVVARNLVVRDWQRGDRRGLALTMGAIVVGQAAGMVWGELRRHLLGQDPDDDDDEEKAARETRRLVVDETGQLIDTLVPGSGQLVEPVLRVASGVGQGMGGGLLFERAVQQLAGGIGLALRDAGKGELPALERFLKIADALAQLTGVPVKPAMDVMKAAKKRQSDGGSGATAL